MNKFMVCYSIFILLTIAWIVATAPVSYSS